MFRDNNGAAAEPRPDVVPCDHPVPLSVLELDLDQAPAGGWAAYLADRGIELALDNVGRLAVARQDARTLLAEKREDEERRREAAARQEQQAIEQDQERRAQIWRGVPRACFLRMSTRLVRCCSRPKTTPGRADSPFCNTRCLTRKG
jgi:hypothetical protein